VLENGSVLAIYKKWIPIIVSETSSGLKITYFFKSFPFESYLQTAYSRFIDKSKEVQEEVEADNFYVQQVMGGKERESGGDSSPARPSGGSLSEHVESTGSSGGGSGVLADVTVLGAKNEFIGLSYDDLGDDEKRERKEYYWSEEGKAFLKEVEFWRSSEKWFNDRQIPWRRGCLLSGIFGGGKSRLVLETAKKLKIPLYKMNVSNMSDKEFTTFFENAPHSSIVLLDDIDVIFHGRENVLAGKSLSKQLLSFDTLINTLSGVKQKNGVFVVMSANNPQLLDPALTRSGRLDVKIELKSLCDEGRRFIATNILCDWPDLIEEAVQTGTGMTASDFENQCIQTAINKFYENAPALHSD
jgi:hypothetical protein